MVETSADVLDSLRPEVLDRLMEVRATVDESSAFVDADSAREQFRSVLTELMAQVAERDAARLRDFVARWIALRLSDGQPPRSLLHTIVAIADVTAEVARARLPAGQDLDRVLRDLVTASFDAARAVVEALAAELGSRR